MFYSEEMLSRRGPLGRVWLAAHMERKLSKAQTLQTDIEQSVGEILGQEVELMALRLSGQLLLGVVRIYSRKARYLLDDCNEALLKIKMAFRPGAVDMTEDQLAVNKNAITLQEGALDIDLLLPDINWDREFNFEDRPLAAHGQHQANIADITLRTTADAFGSGFGMDDPFDLGPSDGLGSQDFDLGLDWGDKPENEDNMSVDGSVGVGRDLPVLDESLDGQFMRNGDMDIDLFSTHSKSRAASEHPFDGDMMNIDLPDMDLGINFGDEREKTPDQIRDSRASSPLSDVPPTPPPGEPIPLPSDKTPKGKRKPKEKKQIIDSVTELAGGPGSQVGRRNNGLGPAVAVDVSDILAEQHFIPRDPLVARLLEIREDPIAHFLPTKVTPNGSFFFAGPPGLAPELAELFMHPFNTPSAKRKLGANDKPASKRPRLDEVDDEPEQLRRAGSVAPSIAGRSEIRAGSMVPDATFDFGDQNGIPLDDFQLDIPELDVNLRGKSVPPSELSRLSTPAPDIFDETAENYADATCPIYMFDTRTQSQAVDETAEGDGKGYSKNTIKALGIIRKELKPADDEDEAKTLSFRQMADKASRRAAASFFFELLVLSTRDCIKINQAKPFDNIEVQAKDKLWERQGHGAPSRAASVARSVGSALGL
ncbi:RAD21 protein [Mycena indigotica]|uniref:RAD21 protein n=1 Tax=Mycena indigotica TaxID=2126181 RepID=A0A8H6TES2_9AGAR|nr:RAD21 protein [Mycena indigotica]KAF7315386.1 RAD21 protein [Mycena indigotica]